MHVREMDGYGDSWEVHSENHTVTGIKWSSRESLSLWVRFVPGFTILSTVYTKDRFSPLVPDLQGSPSYLKCTEGQSKNAVP